MQRIEADITTGEQTAVDLTAEEIADAEARTAAEQPTLNQVLSEKKASVNALRDKKTSSDFTHVGKVLDADLGAQMAIAHAISYGQLNVIPDATTRTWTLADNTTEIVTWGVFREMASGMFERASLLHGEARAHKDAIEVIASGPGTDAEKVVLIEAYIITTGWTV